MQLFRTCEDLENGEGLRWMYKIVKGISKYIYSRLVSLCPHFYFGFGFSILLSSKQRQQGSDVHMSSLRTSVLEVGM